MGAICRSSTSPIPRKHQSGSTLLLLTMHCVRPGLSTSAESAIYLQPAISFRKYGRKTDWNNLLTLDFRLYQWTTPPFMTAFSKSLLITTMARNKITRMDKWDIPTSRPRPRGGIWPFISRLPAMNPGQSPPYPGYESPADSHGGPSAGKIQRLHQNFLRGGLKPKDFNKYLDKWQSIRKSPCAHWNPHFYNFPSELYTTFPTDYITTSSIWQE